MAKPNGFGDICDKLLSEPCSIFGNRGHFLTDQKWKIPTSVLCRIYQKPKDKKDTAQTLICHAKIIYLTLRSKFKAKVHQPLYVTHFLELIYSHTKNIKCLNQRKQSYSLDTMCYNWTDWVKDGLITIVHPPYSNWALINFLTFLSTYRQQLEIIWTLWHSYCKIIQIDTSTFTF